MSEPDRKQSEANNNAGTLLACFGLLILLCGLIGLMSLVLPQFLFLIPILFGFSFLILFHYLTWGRLLSKRGSKSQSADDLTDA